MLQSQFIAVGAISAKSEVVVAIRKFFWDYQLVISFTNSTTMLMP